MEDWKLFDAEYKFMSILWELGPVGSTELVRVCRERLGWKKSTTYTVLRKLGERGFLVNENAMVRALVKREQVQSYESQVLLDRAFDGSLPAFVAAFLRDRRLSPQEVQALKKMIEEAAE